MKKVTNSKPQNSAPSTTLKKLTWLLWILSTREIKRKYSSTALGFTWIFIQPLIQMAIFTVIFSIIIPVGIKNYWIYVLSGLIPWSFFSNAITSATDSIVINRDLIKKISFQRLFIPIASLTAQFPVFFVSLIVLIICSYIIGTMTNFLLLIFSICILILLTLGLSLFTSSLEVYFRDVSFILQICLMIGFYATPIVYPLNLVPQEYQKIYFLNPLAGIISSLKYALLGGHFESWYLWYPLIISLIIFLFGFKVFQKRSRFFADWL